MNLGLKSLMIRLLSSSPSIDDLYTYNLKTDRLNKNLTANIDIDQEFQFNQQIKTDFFSFKLIKNKSFNLKRFDQDKDLSFKLHQRSKIVSSFIEGVSINPVNKETSVLKLKMTAENPGKSIVFLNTLCESYINNGLNDKNNMAINTIEFIDKQLNLIKDSLVLIENNLERFKRSHPNIENIEQEYGAYFQKQKIDNSLAEQSVNTKYYTSLLNYLSKEIDANSIISPTSMGITNPELNTLISQLLQLLAKKGDLELTTTSKNPNYISLLSQISHTN